VYLLNLRRSASKKSIYIKYFQKNQIMNVIQKIGLGIFIIGLLTFTASLGLDKYALTADSLNVSNEYHASEILEVAQQEGMLGKTYDSSFDFITAFKGILKKAQQSLNGKAKEPGVPEGVGEWDYKMGDWVLKDYILYTTKKSATGPVSDKPALFLFLTIGLGILGGLIYILPKFNLIPGIKNDRIYHRPMTKGLQLSVRAFFLGATIIGILLYGFYYMNNQYFWPALTAIVALLIMGAVWLVENQRAKQPARSASVDFSGWLGILTGVYLIGFYVLLYWNAEYITPWMTIADPLSKSLSGNEASQWFLYGTLYTVIVLVMGVRMLTKYMHNRYQLIRTGSVMFFQTAFAFLLPEILVRLNYPYYDFKNIWPLNYTFFFDWNIQNLINSGGLGIFMLGWGIALILLGVPLITYFYGKRWYCSWVCGCGGLAETLGDPYRQLSDKSLNAWKMERWIIHLVLVFAVIMTMGVLYSFLPKEGAWFNQQVFLGLMIVLLLGAMTFVFLRWRQDKFNFSSLGIYAGWGVTLILVGVSAYHIGMGDGKFLFMSSGVTRQWYGFLIGAGFAGVVGTGFYPLMGNRVWCRFGCPLAAYLGLVQRFKSRFRITTNGGQCISCGNCSTYCEMGIDVRWYAQRGQDIVRSSCVGCGICSAVCPRGVLRLENSTVDVDTRATELRAIHITEEKIALVD
jgi:polyferredoxin